MNFNISIADEKSSNCLQDHQYNETNIVNVFRRIPSSKLYDLIPKTEMPIQAMANDIAKYYDDCFAPQGKFAPDNIKLRFVLHKKNGVGEYADAGENEIRLFMQSFPIDECASATDLDIWMRFVLAHEFFHIVHRAHYNSEGTGTWGDVLEDDIGTILAEVFAEYFANACMESYFENDDNGKKRFHGLVDTSKGAILFGCGRKELLDRRRVDLEGMEVREPPNIGCRDTQALIKENRKKLSTADYHGGRVVYLAANQTNGGKQGRSFGAYCSAYEKMLRGDYASALLDLIKLKKILWPNLFFFS